MRFPPPALAATLALTLAVGLAPPASAADTPVKGKVVAADLFKNGLAVIRYEVTLGKPGVYVLDDVPAPVHGTFRVESATPVEVVSQLREVEVPAGDTPPADLQADLAGQDVVLHFKGDKRPPVGGVMLKLKPAKPAADEVATVEYPGLGYGTAPLGSRMIVLQTGKGRTYVEAGEVASIEALDPGATVTRQRPRLRLTLGATDKPETKVTLHYLARGLAWAASYQIDTTDPKTLALEQHAVVRNELADLAGAELRLISGYPSVEFGHVTSPLAPRATWAAYFAQLASGPGREVSVLTQNTFQVVDNRRAEPGVMLGAAPAGEGADLHYQPIGARSLAVGETLALTVAGGKAGYERVVEWTVADHRDESGRYGSRPATGDDDAWDALVFKNPLPFPMTTGPAAVRSGGKFGGQRTSYFVNAGEGTSLRVGKALSVRTRAVESERQPAAGEPGGRETVWVGGRQYRKTTVDGELTVGNFRGEPTRVLVRRRFSGDLLKAEGDPKTVLREEGVTSVNRRYELSYSVPLKAGEERALKYSYTVLVPN